MNIAVLSCKNIKDETCLGCHRCLMGFDKKEGEFARYQGTDAKMRAFLHCGGCPGTSPVLRLVGLKTWMAPMGETIDAVHIGTCLLDNCPHKDTIIQKVKAKAGVEVIEGSHPYRPVQVFGQ
ncbi:MAG TPA: metal-binding protein [Syntrophobacteraceae bacterium]|jgi:predicted metal-binding protein|nr:metal-binding protein [Syntrophobacteraceae bacterium]